MLRVDDLTGRLQSELDRRLLDARHRLEILIHRISPRQLSERLAARRSLFAAQRHRLASAAAARLRRGRDEVAGYGEQLTALSPLSVLSRGYAICHAESTGAILKNARRVRPGETIRIRLHRGGLGCEVKEVHDATREEDL